MHAHLHNVVLSHLFYSIFSYNYFSFIIHSFVHARTCLLVAVLCSASVGRELRIVSPLPPINNY